MEGMDKPPETGIRQYQQILITLLLHKGKATTRDHVLMYTTTGVIRNRSIDRDQSMSFQGARHGFWSRPNSDDVLSLIPIVVKASGSFLQRL